MAIVNLALDFLERSGQILLFQHAQVIISQCKSTEVVNIFWFGHTLKKKVTLNSHFPRPAESDPYIYILLSEVNLNMGHR